MRTDSVGRRNVLGAFLGVFVGMLLAYLGDLSMVCGGLIGASIGFAGDLLLKSGIKNFPALSRHFVRAVGALLGLGIACVPLGLFFVVPAISLSGAFFGKLFVITAFMVMFFGVLYSVFRLWDGEGSWRWAEENAYREEFFFGLKTTSAYVGLGSVLGLWLLVIGPLAFLMVGAAWLMIACFYLIESNELKATYIRCVGVVLGVLFSARLLLEEEFLRSYVVALAFVFGILAACAAEGLRRILIAAKDQPLQARGKKLNETSQKLWEQVIQDPMDRIGRVIARLSVYPRGNN